MDFLKIQKHSGSKSVTIPYRICRKLNLHVGDSLSCTLSIDGYIILKPQSQDKDKPCLPEQSSTSPLTK